MFMKTTKAIGLIFLLLVILFVLSYPLQARISHIRQEEDLGDPGVVLEPGEFAGSLLLGGMRGPAVVMLWVRAQNLQQEGQFYELLALSRVIAKLQPDFSSVWIFMGWNMAYNLSFEYEAKEDKWKWIEEGLEYYKEGVRKNPKNWETTWNLGYTYFHKVDADPYFRKKCRELEGKPHFLLAREYFERASTLPDHHKSVERSLGVVTKKLGQLYWAEQNFSKALSSFQDSVIVWEDFMTNLSPGDSASKGHLLELNAMIKLCSSEIDAAHAWNSGDRTRARQMYIQLRDPLKQFVKVQQGYEWEDLLENQPDKYISMVLKRVIERAQ